MLSFLCFSAGDGTKERPIIVERNGMTVTIERSEERLHILMEAPTRGWIGIGFNESEELRGTYLLMGAVKGEKVIFEEHAVLSPGNYKTFRELGVKTSVEQAQGTEKDGYTAIRFELPIHSPTEHGKDLSAGTTYHLLMAFSREDDFQHHSMMRTSVPIKL